MLYYDTMFAAMHSVSNAETAEEKEEIISRMDANKIEGPYRTAVLLRLDGKGPISCAHEYGWTLRDAIEYLTTACYMLTGLTLEQAKDMKTKKITEVV